MVDIPVDTYDSALEFVIIMPLGGVEKESIKISLQLNELHVVGERKKPNVKETLHLQKSGCFWGSFSKVIKLPENSYLTGIHSELSPENILSITVPKNVEPTEISVVIQ